ncbi:hypothetical protein UFOVP598_45 [uncultured Caudovirales phage]|uniref:Uncharacterized protein n=1 Tax=uncultured Caudovirales phage TaxID=2100421 RepID=A0A6J5N3Q5_9CAUD|nr:hypothetical protein UFOVP598_45 [uncultured Caudovirales phage]
MNTKSKAFHIYFSIIRDIIANDEKAKLITTKIVDEIIESHIYIYDTENIFETIKYWQEVKQEITKL